MGLAGSGLIPAYQRGGKQQRIKIRSKVTTTGEVHETVLEYRFSFIRTLIAALGIDSFLLPNHFIDGGITGVSMLLSSQFGIPLPLLLVLVNLPFVLLGYRHVSPEFAIKSIVAIGVAGRCC